MQVNKVTKAIESLKKGKLIILADSEDRESEGDFIGLASNATANNVNFMITEGKGLLCVPLTKKRAKQLNLKSMANNSSDPLRTAFTTSIDYKTSTTGISASERAKTIQELANHRARADDFYTPGHIFPLIAMDGGVLVREGHTEAAVDLAILAKSKSCAYICEIIKEDGSMARRKDLSQLASKFNLDYITIEELITYRYQYDKSIVKLISSVHLPTKFGDFTLKAYSFVGDDKEYVVMVKGNLKSEEPTLVRLHSECLTGDVFGSLRCDCREQLEKSLAEIEEHGKGVLIYLRQEGRGIGLFNKLKAYELQEQGLDTLEANLEFRLPIDNREYGMAAAILHNLNIKEVNLITNNPLKVEALKKYGIKVVNRIGLNIKPRKENKKYLLTKKDKFKHFIDI